MCHDIEHNSLLKSSLKSVILHGNILTRAKTFTFWTTGCLRGVTEQTEREVVTKPSTKATQQLFKALPHNACFLPRICFLKPSTPGFSLSCGYRATDVRDVSHSTNCRISCHWRQSPLHTMLQSAEPNFSLSSWARYLLNYWIGKMSHCPSCHHFMQGCIHPTCCIILQDWSPSCSCRCPSGFSELLTLGFQTVFRPLCRIDWEPWSSEFKVWESLTSWVTNIRKQKKHRPWSVARGWVGRSSWDSETFLKGFLTSLYPFYFCLQIDMDLCVSGLQTIWVDNSFSFPHKMRKLVF